MVDLSKLKDVKLPSLNDERMKLRAMIALNIGMAMGMLAAFIAILLANMVWYYKTFAAFGLFCACCLQLFGVFSTIKQLKAYNAAMKEYERLNTNTEPVAYAG
jgi:hypothetical protein